MYSKKTLTLLAVIAGLALIAAYWKDIRAALTPKVQGSPNTPPDASATPIAETSTGSAPAPVASTGKSAGSNPFADFFKLVTFGLFDKSQPAPAANNGPTVPTGTGQVQVDAWTRYNALPAPVKPSATQTLKRGVKSRAVFVLQGMLNAGFGKNLYLDGIFGDNTETALNSVLGKKQTSLSEFIRLKVPENSPARPILKSYGLA